MFTPRRSVRQSIECPCGEWRWREVTIQSAIGAIERYCPRCRRRMLIVLRGPELVGVVPFGGAHEMPISQALDDLKVTKWESRILLLVAREMAT